MQVPPEVADARTDDAIGPGVVHTCAEGLRSHVGLRGGDRSAFEVDAVRHATRFEALELIRQSVAGISAHSPRILSVVYRFVTIMGHNTWPLYSSANSPSFNREFACFRMIAGHSAEVVASHATSTAGLPPEKWSSVK